MAYPHRSFNPYNDSRPPLRGMNYQQTSRRESAFEPTTLTVGSGRHPTSTRQPWSQLANNGHDHRQQCIDGRYYGGQQHTADRYQGQPYTTDRYQGQQYINDRYQFYNGQDQYGQQGQSYQDELRRNQQDYRLPEDYDYRPPSADLDPNHSPNYSQDQGSHNSGARHGTFASRNPQSRRGRRRQNNDNNRRNSRRNIIRNRTGPIPATTNLSAVSDRQATEQRMLAESVEHQNSLHELISKMDKPSAIPPTSSAATTEGNGGPSCQATTTTNVPTTASMGAPTTQAGPSTTIPQGASSLRTTRIGNTPNRPEDAGSSSHTIDPSTVTQALTDMKLDLILDFMTEQTKETKAKQEDTDKRLEKSKG